ncbi:flavin-containing monooxygenase [Dactylosporangium sp. CS-033363]|uniref:flavin-containing monooxygenase n=1 Tax=Dactylosporangium sp. CS-033363 TaxID=3239935 RepID=UPI003D950144
MSYDVIVIGAGFAGLAAAHRARRAGLTVHGFEAGDDVGGTWYWNRYPGARCDVESVDYSYSFDEDLQQEWTWSERFAAQPEILAYLRHAARRFGLYDLFELATRVAALRYTGSAWDVTTADGRTERARFVILATGSLSIPNIPAIPGAGDFRGEVYRTAQWPAAPVAFAGKRVGIIGTGSSGIQTAPEVAREAAALTVFQRTANYSIPAVSAPLPAEEIAAVKAGYAARRARTRRGLYGSPAHDPHPVPAPQLTPAEATRVLQERWAYGGVYFARTFLDQMSDAATNRIAGEFVQGQIRRIVRDPAVAEDLVPADHPIGTKRICTDSGYFETFNRPNVRLVNLRRDPIERIEPGGVRTATGLHELDVLIWATGFDAFTGAAARMDIRGRDGVALSAIWSGGPLTYLGLLVPGLPNLVLLNGPGSTGPLANMVLCAEQQIDWVFDLLAAAGQRGAAAFDVAPGAAERWSEVVDEAARRTLFPKARSWYLGSNIEGKPERFMPYAGGLGAYVDLCAAEADAGYPGLTFG